MLHVVPAKRETQLQAFIALFNASALIKCPLHDVRLGCEFEMLDLDSSRIYHGSVSSQFAMIRYLDKQGATMRRPARPLDIESVSVSAKYIFRSLENHEDFLLLDFPPRR
jgi:hypothetical protein